MKTVDPILFDTNVLVYNQDQESVFYKEAAEYHRRAIDGEIRAVISSQNLLEFTSVMLNPKKITRPLSKEIVTQEIKKYLQSGFFTIIYPSAETMNLFTDLVARNTTQNPLYVFDLFLITTMLANDVKRILTANTADFQDKGLEVISLRRE